MHTAKEHGGITITGVVSTLSSVQGGLINRYVGLGCGEKKNLQCECRNIGSARANARYTTQ